MNGRVMLTLQDRAVMNGAPLHLVELEGGAGWVTIREVGQQQVCVGRACAIDRVVPYALALLENDPEAMAFKDGRRLLALAVLGLFASASIRNLEPGDPADAPR